MLGGKIAGWSPIIVVESRKSRRDVAERVGADHGIDPAVGDLAAAVRQVVPDGADLIVDTSGDLPAVTAAVGMIAKKGKLGLVGLPGATSHRRTVHCHLRRFSPMRSKGVGRAATGAD